MITDGIPLISDALGFTCESPSDIYVDIIEEILKRGYIVSPRGMETKEITRSMVITRNPMKRLVLVPNRKINPFFLVAEAIWILAGQSNADYITQFNKGISRFLDTDGSGQFHAPYGERIRRHYYSEKMGSSHLNVVNMTWLMEIDQVQTVVETLKNDPDSRRAVICLWDPYMDTQESRDIPCNDMVFFKIRDNKLNMTVVNRSNDAILGFPVTNLFQFSILMELVANLLGVEVGTYCQFSDSLHLYTDQKIIEEVLSVKYPGWYQAPVLPMRKMSIGDNKNVLTSYDQIFKDLIHLVPILCIQDIHIMFPENLGIFRDFAFYIKCFLFYKAKMYSEAYHCLIMVEDFNLFLAGLEFMYRAIKDFEGKTLFNAEDNWKNVVERLGFVDPIYEDIPEVILASAKFFLYGGQEQYATYESIH